jgi:DNA topoisomerase-1
MSKKYCFRIINPDEKTFNKEELENFVRDLYNKNSEDQSKLSFRTFYSYATDSICIEMKGRGKALIANIEKINSNLKDTDLKWKDSISLSKPYVPDDRQVLSFKVTPGRKWDSIIQRGPYFSEIMEPYEHLGASLWLKSNPEKKYKLNPKEEKIARFYAKRMLSEAGDNITVTYTTTKESDTKQQKEVFALFNKNFWTDFQTYLSVEAKKIFKSEQDFLNIDWSDLIKLHLIQIEKNKEIAKDKDRKAKRVAEKMDEYGYATINGVPLQKLANFSVEPSGIFLGRGVNPLLGRIKKEILPEDVTLNLGENDLIPEPPLDHKWGRIVHDYNSEWVASWKDNVTGRTKYVWFSQEGAFKAQSDIKKYEKARKLHSKIEEIRNAYMVDAKSTNLRTLQLGTVLYLVDHFGIRVGNEKDEDEAETVGATTLLVDNVNLDTENHVIFNFLGKDSVLFYKDLEVDPIIFKNFKKLTKGKAKNEEIFHQIKSEDINEYLKEFDKDFSAKVFRTRLASDIMYHALINVKIPDKSTNKFIKLNFAKANAEVAEVLNHARTPSKKAKEALEKLKTELAEARIKNDTKKIQTLTENIESKENVLTVAINTSLANYIDPRLVVSWAKTEKVEPSAIYSKTLLNKFKWAVESTEDGWDWEKSPLENEDVSPTQPKTSRTPSRQPSVPRRPSPRQPSVPRRPSPRQPSSVPAKSEVASLKQIFDRLSGGKNRLLLKEVLRACQKGDSDLRKLLIFDTNDDCKEKAILLFGANLAFGSEVSVKSEINFDQFAKYFRSRTPSRKPSNAARKPPPPPQSSSKAPPPPQSSSKAPPPPQSSSKAPPPPQNQDPFSGKLGPGTIKDYKLLLQLCEDLENYNQNISQVETVVLDWIYPFCKEAVERGVNVEATKFIVDYYEKYVLKRPVNDTPVVETIARTPPSKKVPTKIKDDSSDEEEETPPISAPPKKERKKIEKSDRQDIRIPDDERYMRFKYLNTYKKEADLRNYCNKYGIRIEPKYNMKDIKMAIMEFYKDDTNPPFF